MQTAVTIAILLGLPEVQPKETLLPLLCLEAPDIENAPIVSGERSRVKGRSSGARLLGFNTSSANH